MKSFDIVNISSDEYDLNKDYIYVGTNELDIDKVNVVNGTKEVKDNNLLIKYEDNLLKSFDIVSISSDEYDLNKDYIYVGTNLEIDKVNVINGTKEVKNNKLLIKYNEDVLREYFIYSFDLGQLVVRENSIIITEDISYSDFISNVTLNDILNYKIYNGNNLVTSGNIIEGMILKIYYNEEVIDSYDITDEYIDMSLLNVDEEKELIKDLILGKNVSEFKDKISTSGVISVVDKDDIELTSDELITSGSKVKIELSSEIYEYTLSVKGDVTGTGTSTISDVAKLYQYLKKKIDMEECYIEAGNVVDSDNEIKINDVAKLYQFIKKKIESLED